MKKNNNFIFNLFSRNLNWIFPILFLLTIYLMEARQTKITNFDCEICSDKAGYYMYLPAVFYLGFEASKYPDKFDEKCGLGFTLDHQNDKVVTKFTSGLAILLSPFYGTGYLIDKMFSLGAEPYSNYYLFFINIGGAFYIILGLFFLHKFLRYYVNQIVSLLTILTLFFGTNLYYYVIDEPLMSHMYSFSMFCILLYGIKSFYTTKKLKHFLLFVIPLSIAILIRPTNALFGLFVLFLDVNSLETLKNQLKILFKPKLILLGTFVLFVVLLPQLFYWKFAYGKFLVWSYKGEGFLNWKSPELLITWFSPQSGLFIYTPIILLFLAFTLIMIIKKQKNAVLVLAAFFITSYMCASWSDLHFGLCNFGKRPMVEFLPLFSIPIAYIFNNLRNYSIFISVPLIILIICFVLYNILLVDVFDTCFFGKDWEWHKFFDLLQQAFLMK